MSVSPVLSHVLIVSAPSCLNRSLQENIQFGFSVGCVVQNSVIMALNLSLLMQPTICGGLFFVGTTMILCPWHEHTLTGQELLLIYNTSSLLCFCDGHLPRVGQAALPSFLPTTFVPCQYLPRYKLSHSVVIYTCSL